MSDRIVRFVAASGWSVGHGALALGSRRREEAKGQRSGVTAVAGASGENQWQGRRRENEVIEEMRKGTKRAAEKRKAESKQQPVWRVSAVVCLCVGIQSMEEEEGCQQPVSRLGPASGGGETPREGRSQSGRGLGSLLPAEDEVERGSRLSRHHLTT